MGNPLAQYRDDHNLTMDGLAEQLGVKKGTISRWLSGQRNIDLDLLPRVSKVTGIPAALLRPDLAKLICEGTD